MKNKPLGGQGIITSELGLGCMGMSEFYGPRNDEESLKVLKRSYELGITFWDTSDMYGPHLNEELISRALKGIRNDITVATKFGIVRDSLDPAQRGINGRPEYVKQACEGSLRRLQIETIDLYYLHRVDPATPIEETVGAMSDLIRQGKIRAIGLSEASAATLRRAHAIHPVTALQSEYSLWTRDPEDEVLPACKELGIGFVAYSPLGRGFLTGKYKSADDFAADDFRRMSPRFQGENFNKNLDLVRKVEALAGEKGCTPSQLALAWVMAQDDFIFPIPGTKQLKYLEENAGVLRVKLSKVEMASLESVFPKGVAAGGRYSEAGMKAVNR